MTPAARAAAAIYILDIWEAGDQRAEKILRDWGRANRYAGSKDRLAIGDLVYTCLRRRRSLAWGRGATGGRGMVLGLVLDEGAEADEVFSGAKYAPPVLTDDEAALVEAPALDPVAHDHPDWMETALKQSLGDAYGSALSALQTRAPIGLRVNRLRATVEDVMDQLAEDGVEAIASPLDPDALVAPPGARIAMARAYTDGLVELQDPASQVAARLAAAAPGETVLDYCAGGGGKTLALASHMQGEGRLIAHDISAARLAQAQDRAARAGAVVELAEPGAPAGDLAGRCDLVFVDAPCSGSGSWRRDPEGKWRLTEDRLAKYQALQRQVFADAMAFVRPGGRIAYATCSLFQSENDQQISHFLEQFTGLSPGARLMLMPDELHDGFFCQMLHLP